MKVIYARQADTLGQCGCCRLLLPLGPSG